LAVVGADRVAAEWVIRNGGEADIYVFRKSVFAGEIRWTNSQEFTTDYNRVAAGSDVQ
jgi:hypothetical protein